MYPWWGATPVFLFVYIPFFLASAYAYDWQPRTQRRMIGSLAIINALMLIVFGGVLRWI